MWSIGLREGGCVVVCIAIAGGIARVIGLGSRMCMRRDETIWREWHLFR